MIVFLRDGWNGSKPRRGPLRSGGAMCCRYPDLLALPKGDSCVEILQQSMYMCLQLKFIVYSNACSILQCPTRYFNIQFQHEQLPLFPEMGLTLMHKSMLILSELSKAALLHGTIAFFKYTPRITVIMMLVAAQTGKESMFCCYCCGYCFKGRMSRVK